MSPTTAQRVHIGRIRSVYRQFDRATGQLIRTYALPTNLAVATPSAQDAVEISGNTTGRTANKGMEGPAITPDGKTLVGIVQAELIRDKGKVVRIVTVDIAPGATRELGCKLTTGSGVRETVALNGALGGILRRRRAVVGAA